MSKKKHKRNSYFHVGKNIPPNDKRRTPIDGEPNSFLDTYRKSDGHIFRRRKFGKNGKAYVDLDTPHLHNNTEHAHDYDGMNRRSARPLTTKEVREMKKAKKKRRFWHDKK